MEKKILIIAFHFPPFSGSSGVQRTLRFAQHLINHSWNPIILTASEHAYENCSEDLLAQVPKSIKVHRAFALDTSRHLSFKGKYFQILGLPDRWISWAPAAILKGLKLAKNNKPRIIWSTYPLATTHLVAFVLQQITSIPWVADFRDPMVEKDAKTGKWFPNNQKVRGTRLWIEKKVMLHATNIVFCTDGAKQICIDRYPDTPKDKMIVIPNGYDESTFSRVEKTLPPNNKKDTPITLLHSGVLYNTMDRNPKFFFAALARLKHNHKISASRLQVILRSPSHDEEYRSIINRLKISDIVKIMPSIPYEEALLEMMAADGLLIFQGYTSNPAIPAKLYEYLRAKRPIFALADSEGDTAKLLTQLNMNFITPFSDIDAIEKELTHFLIQLESNSIKPAPDEAIKHFSREHTAQMLATLLDTI